MVMSFILAVLVILLKVVGLVLAAGVALILLMLSLPAKARVSGSAAATGLLEGLLEDDATLLVRLGGSAPETPEETEGPVVPVALDLAVEAGVLSGAVGFSGGVDGRSRVTVFGLPVCTRSGKPRPRDEQEDGDTLAVKQAGKGRKGLRARLSKKALELTTRKTGEKGGISVRKVRQYLSPEVRGKTWDALRSLFRALHLHGKLDLQCGFQDPGNTAMVNAAYWGLGGPSRFGSITFRPVFSGEAFDVKGMGEVQLVPVQIGWIAARYLLSREIRPLWRKPKAGRSGGADANRSVGAVIAN